MNFKLGSPQYSGLEYYEFIPHQPTPFLNFNTIQENEIKDAEL